MIAVEITGEVRGELAYSEIEKNWNTSQSSSSASGRKSSEIIRAAPVVTVETIA